MRTACESRELMRKSSNSVAAYSHGRSGASTRGITRKTLDARTLPNFDELLAK